MKKEVYLCDNCGVVLSDPVEDINKNHLSINFASHSGWVQRGEGLNAGVWRHHGEETKGIKQFCNGECLGSYFDKIKKQKIKG